MKFQMLSMTFLLLTIPMQAQAASLKGGYPACLSEIKFEEMVSASRENNNEAVNQLLNSHCVITRAGAQVSVVKVGWGGVTKVRAGSYDLWTNTENVVP